MLLNGGELDGQRLLKSETVALMTRNQIGEFSVPGPGHGDKFGYGFGVLTKDGQAQDPEDSSTRTSGSIRKRN
jgi:CubicO group peptidase (beta-lactamase class C family)